eukprot:scaffold27605_cov157-Isochrysis_galbana.AAC.1
MKAGKRARAGIIGRSEHQPSAPARKAVRSSCCLPGLGSRPLPLARHARHHAMAAPILVS